MTTDDGTSGPCCEPAMTLSPRNPKTEVMEIWINPNCSKCRFALSMLDTEGARYTVRYYLEEPPTVQELEDVLQRLRLEPWDIARTGEPVATELGLATWPRGEADRVRWLEVLVAHPILIQRPIITADDGTAVIGRSPESVRSVLT
jgi:arsenate reductase (glutaredoxin)